eukprot:scaffold567236_cov27-Prasinocladus_malaysianus.AAC.1
MPGLLDPPWIRKASCAFLNEFDGIGHAFLPLHLQARRFHPPADLRVHTGSRDVLSEPLRRHCADRPGVYTGPRGLDGPAHPHLLPICCIDDRGRACLDGGRGCPGAAVVDCNGTPRKQPAVWTLVHLKYVVSSIPTQKEENRKRHHQQYNKKGQHEQENGVEDCRKKWEMAYHM